MQQYNYFIEGIPGSGKSYLAKAILEKKSDYKAYQEGDISPVELAWCSYMTRKEYDEAIEQWPAQKEEVERLTVWETRKISKPCKNARNSNTQEAGSEDNSTQRVDMAIVPYTKIRTEQFDFYKYMEKYEIYSGRRSLEEFTSIVYGRYAFFHGTGNIFECSFFQNTIEELMLYQLLSDEEIINFYTNLITNIAMSSFRMIRLVAKDPSDNLRQISDERVNEKGEKEWYKAMMDYLKSSPYGKQHEFNTFDDLLAHFARRTKLEEEVIRVLPKECVKTVESKNYCLEDLICDERM